MNIAKVLFCLLFLAACGKSATTCERTGNDATGDSSCFATVTCTDGATLRIDCVEQADRTYSCVCSDAADTQKTVTGASGTCANNGGNAYTLGASTCAWKSSAD
jgi:hypothetical protein